MLRRNQSGDGEENPILRTASGTAVRCIAVPAEEGGVNVVVSIPPYYQLLWLEQGGQEDDLFWEARTFDTAEQGLEELSGALGRLVGGNFVVSVICWSGEDDTEGYSSVISVPDRFGLISSDAPRIFPTSKDAFAHMGEAVDQLRGNWSHWKDMELLNSTEAPGW